MDDNSSLDNILFNTLNPTVAKQTAINQVNEPIIDTLSSDSDRQDSTTETTSFLPNYSFPSLST
ncbi:MAG: hypothetical protein KAR35_09410, partial [Candidatus Heimdallarchaeota archaeon]|nr:hypothetical protein [Candidatus Heimdallarchaeota archaeon]MCK5049573.1 hypothetical protein [Candidatus Heimdallarchaeota archaeon]